MLPPNWTLRTDYATRHDTGHCTLRHPDLASIVAQAWRIERALAGVVWPVRRARWGQVELFSSIERNEQ